MRKEKAEATGGRDEHVHVLVHPDTPFISFILCQPGSDLGPEAIKGFKTSKNGYVDVTCPACLAIREEERKWL